MRTFFAAVFAALAAASCIPTIKDEFAKATYPEKVRPTPPRNLALSLDAVVVPNLLVGYDRPRAVARCLGALYTDAEAPTELWSYGECLARGGTSVTCAARLPFIDEQADSLVLTGCPTRLESERDRMRFVLAVASAAAALYAYELRGAGPSAIGRALPARLRDALVTTLRHAARVLEQDPVERHDAALPALALSGGAANGAFVAGYLHALFWMRERAFLHANPEQRARIDGYRFGSVFASSVGTLVGLPLDLYFTTARPNAAEELALDACLRGKSVGGSGLAQRKTQACALAKLETDFVKNEWDLLCAQPGTVLDLVGPEATSLLRFDPLERTLLEPFFASFQSLALENAFTRTSMAVDLDQSVLVGLDERACRQKGMDARRCLSEAVLSSIVEPIFVPARPRVYSGLAGASGESGTWLDGSIRSLNPAARAAAFTVGKVLAVSTQRAAGIPALPPQGLLPLALNTFDALGAGSRSWELAYARAYQRERARQACELGRLLRNTSLCPGDALGSPSAAPATDDLTGDLLTVWVPEDVAPVALTASGYTFDPLVMRGLFLWGTKELLRSRRHLLDWLGWCAIAGLEDAKVACPVSGISVAFQADLRSRSAEVEKELAGYRKYANPREWQRHVDERRELVEDNLTICRRR